MAAPEIELLLAMFDQAYDKKSWHGTNLKGAIRGLDVDRLRWRPAPDRHNIWEHVLHAAYWKYVVWRRLTGEKRGTFAFVGSNWFRRDEDSNAAQWRADVKVLDEIHRQLRDVIKKLTPAKLSYKPAGSSVSNQMIITGVAHHDIYHAGQIQLLKRLCDNDPRIGTGLRR